MKNIFLFTLSILFISNITLSQDGRIVLDKVAAQIGDKIILSSEIETQIAQLINNGDSISANIKYDILEEMMFQKLLLHQAAIDSIEIPDAQVESEMEGRLRQLEQQIGSRQKLEEFYGKSTIEIKNEFRDAIKERLIAQEMERTITDGMTVSPKEVKSFFESIPEDSIPYVNMQLSFQQIVHYPEITPADKEISYHKLKEIRENILNGRNFETQARIHSMDPGSASLGGKISATRGMMVTQFEATVFALKEGEVSDVFETEYGYHIVKLEDRKGDDYECRHILIIPEVNHNAIIQSATLMDSCYKLLNEGKISWEEAVLKFSNDEITKQNSGVITNPITGEQTWDMEQLNQVDQQIFVLTNVMKEGDISQPNVYTDIFSRKQGIRIVRLMKRKIPHIANLKDDYALIKGAAEEDKKQKIINEWIVNMINKSYVKIDNSYKNASFRYDWLSNN